MSHSEDNDCCDLKDIGRYNIRYDKNSLGHLLMHNLYTKKTFEELLYKLKCNRIDLLDCLTIFEGAGFIESSEIDIKEDKNGIRLSRYYIITNKGKEEIITIHKEVNIKNV